eukprot:CAMPEP_0174831954 /NCGR_PEP_ID=MMETSP1114-20130205/3403_1 /TAXON_ID=312471 /ORGANISM="Neobodo designis, Strain CCAP 1951/1" /LENGTH=428 /DNA_ID=CAMNT_0016065801 /DNA_START=36 /DNA_END=1322 /DNA_ORIENTATION=-
MSLRRRPRKSGRDGDAAEGPSDGAAGQPPMTTESSGNGGAIPGGPAMGGGTRVWITLTSGSSGISGTLTFQLDPIKCPRAATNFKFLCDAHRDTEGYKRRQAFLGEGTPLPPPLRSTTVSAIRRNEMLEFGSSATASYYGGFFPDDKPVLPNSSSSATSAAPAPTAAGFVGCTNDRLGALSMCNVGPDTNASRFFITLTEGQAELDKDFVCFGQLVDGFDVLEALNSGDIKTDPRRGHAPRERLYVSDCGVVDPLAAFKAASAAAAGSEAEAAAVVGGRRGRGTDEVLSGALDVARIRVDADDAGATADDRIHSTMAMAGAMKKRRGEAVDPRFAGQLAAVAIDASAPLEQVVVKPTAQEAIRQQQRVFEFDAKELTGEHRHKANRKAAAGGGGGLRDRKLGQLAQQRREKAKAAGRPKSRANKAKYY